MEELAVNNQRLIHEEFKFVKANYPDLNLLSKPDTSWDIYGDLHFLGTNSQRKIEDQYSVLILVPNTYPQKLPTVKEMGGRIPKDFHTNSDGTLCLGTPLLIKMKYYEEPNLLGFINNCLVPYLYGFSYMKKYGELPNGEFSHGIPGIIQHYKELFNSQSLTVIINLIKILAYNSYRGHKLCPCGSGKKLRNCHGKILLDLKKYQSSEEFLTDSHLLIKYSHSKHT